jgi:hypothetical protein
MQVIVVDWFKLTQPIVAEGESDGKVVEQLYTKVNGQLYNVASVYADVPAIRSMIYDRCSQIKNLRDQADKLMYQTLNDIRHQRVDQVKERETSHD